MKYEQNNKFILRFIKVLKAHPVLWKKLDNTYPPPKSQKEALDALLQVCLKYNPGANEDFVKKTLRGLKITYSRANNRRKAAIHAGKPFLSQIWYVDALNFLSKDNAVEEVAEQEHGKPLDLGNGEIQEEATARTESQEFSFDSNQEDMETPDEPQKNEIISQATSAGSSVPASSSDENTLEVPTRPLLFNVYDISEYEAIGINVSAKLRKLPAQQRIFAEALISDVLRHALLQRLTDKSRVKAAAHFPPFALDSF